jgi:biotin transport system substrate-specific component
LKSYIKSTLVAFVATAAVFVFGLAHLSLFVPTENLLQLGLYPFIIGGIIKAVLAASLVVPTHKFFSKL